MTNRLAHSYPGAFLVVEGPDGSGKTTSIKAYEEILRDNGYDVVVTREPGGTDLAEKIRALVLTNEDEPIPGKAELMMFAAARVLHVENKIKPALEAGKVVLCDRFTMSTRAYQGHGRGLKEEVKLIEKFTLGNFAPDYVFFHNAPQELLDIRLARRAGQSDRLDREVSDFKARVHYGFTVEANYMRLESNGTEVIDVDASRSPDYIAARFRNWMFEHFNPEHWKIRGAGIR